MTYMSKKFNIDPKIEIKPTGIVNLPRAKDLSTCYNLFGNQEYSPFCNIGWEEFESVSEFENECYSHILKSKNIEKTLYEIDEIIYNNPDWPRLDLGVAGAVFSLTALGCLCGSSCNGGAFGDFHSEEYPLVVFLAKDSELKILQSAAEKSGVGLDNSNQLIHLYSDNIEKMMLFGSKLQKEFIKNSQFMSQRKVIL